MKTAFKLLKILGLNSQNTTLALSHVALTPSLRHSREGGNPAIPTQWGKFPSKFFAYFYILLDSRLRGNDTERGGNNTEEDGNVREKDRNAMLPTSSPFTLTKCKQQHKN